MSVDCCPPGYSYRQSYTSSHTVLLSPVIWKFGRHHGSVRRPHFTSTVSAPTRRSRTIGGTLGETESLYTSLLQLQLAPFHLASSHRHLSPDSLRTTSFRPTVRSVVIGHPLINPFDHHRPGVLYRSFTTARPPFVGSFPPRRLAQSIVSRDHLWIED